MKIIGKNQDYYDSAIQFGVDETQVFVRKEEKEILEFKDNELLVDLLKAAPNKDESRVFGAPKWSLIPELVFFCGKVYYIYKLSYWVKEGVHTNRKEEFLVDIDAISEKVKDIDPEYFETKWKEVKKKRRPRTFFFDRHIMENEVRDFLEENQGKEVDSAIFHKLKTAYFKTSIKQVTSFDEKIELVKYPVLKDIGFAKLLHPFDAFQEVSQYLFGVIGCVEKDTVDIKDKDKVKGKGFDTEYGFRKRPS